MQPHLAAMSKLLLLVSLQMLLQEPPSITSKPYLECMGCNILKSQPLSQELLTHEVCTSSEINKQLQYCVMAGGNTSRWCWPDIPSHSTCNIVKWLEVHPSGCDEQVPPLLHQRAQLHRHTLEEDTLVEVQQTAGIKACSILRAPDNGLQASEQHHIMTPCCIVISSKTVA